MSERLAALLEGLLEPLVEERLSAAEALALLAGDTALAPARCARPQAHRLFPGHFVSFLVCVTHCAMCPSRVQQVYAGQVAVEV